jgi:hypothetical protein
MANVSHSYLSLFLVVFKLICISCRQVVLSCRSTTIAAEVTTLTRNRVLVHRRSFQNEQWPLPTRLKTTRRSPAKHVSSIGSWVDLQRLPIDVMLAAKIQDWC